jgi:predicted branched-subunit amino acid permease
MSRAPATLRGAREGVRLTWPLVPGIVVFASAYGAAAAQKGMTLTEVLTASAVVFGGAAQMVALEAWRDVWSMAGVLQVALIATIINARMVLMGATLQPWMAGWPAGRTAASAFFLVDASWVIGMRHRAEGGNDLGVFLGSGVFLWVVWVLATAPGYVAGALLPDPKRFGLDMIMPIFFVMMLVPMWRGPRAARPWVVAAVVSLAVQALVPGYLFIVAGALAGAVAGAFLDDGG